MSISERLFGTDGIRGRAGEFPLDAQTVYRLGRALAREGRKNVVIGRDTRASGVWLEQALAAGIESGGGEVQRAGLITTPGIAYLARTLNFDAGVVISASHNPAPDNGIKIFSARGLKLRDAEEDEIQALFMEDIARLDESILVEYSAPELLSAFDEELVERYVQFLETVPAGGSLKGLHVVLDCANGASSHVAPEVFSRLGTRVTRINCEPDGRNINFQCGALHPEGLAERVAKEEADFGVAFDGDSDRAIFADQNGTILDGDYVLYILGKQLRDEGRLPSRTIVGTVMANFGLEKALRREGLTLVRTSVGDRYVLEEMLRGDHNLGGEQSGHVIVREYSPAGDGIQTALLVAQVLSSRSMTLDELARGLEKLPQVLVNTRVKEKRDLSTLPIVSDKIRAIEKQLEGRGRVLVRYSGTEPLARVMVEGEDAAEIEAYAHDIIESLQRVLGEES
ncbi:MAG TPA: phosphoglucosamine mutase [Acidobacteriota bacterium]|nr:phosphoglucosamine mutase [Acidobacteriota bacterium]